MPWHSCSGFPQPGQGPACVNPVLPFALAEQGSMVLFIQCKQVYLLLPVPPAPDPLEREWGNYQEQSVFLTPALSR
jgi:hypothetical protein